MSRETAVVAVKRFNSRAVVKPPLLMVRGTYLTGLKIIGPGRRVHLKRWL